MVDERSVRVLQPVEESFVVSALLCGTGNLPRSACRVSLAAVSRLQPERGGMAVVSGAGSWAPLGLKGFEKSSGTSCVTALDLVLSGSEQHGGLPLSYPCATFLVITSETSF